MQPLEPDPARTDWISSVRFVHRRRANSAQLHRADQPHAGLGVVSVKASPDDEAAKSGAKIESIFI
jgi:hypothetical protein